MPERSPAPLPRAAACVIGGVVLTAVMLQSVLSDRGLAGNFGSSRLWLRSVDFFDGRLVEQPGGETFAEVSLGSLVLWLGLFAACAWAGGAGLLRWIRGIGWSEALAAWGLRGGRWWLLPGAWELLRLVAFAIGLTGLEGLLLTTPQLWLAVSMAGSLTALSAMLWPGSVEAAANEGAPGDSHKAAGPVGGEGRGEGGERFTSLAQEGNPSKRPPPHPRPLSPANPGARGVARASRRWLWLVIAFAAAYAVVFTAMNWQLYRGLLVPHGDSAMYEEHLWNLLHGKGFRSYLDQGLFLGEHIQIIHALLIPLYVLWPSHLLLELCGSAALASGAIPVYFLARRHAGSASAGVWMGAAYLLAIPMQYLDIAIDLKTFRPTQFVIPLFLFALDQMERGRWKTMLALLAVTLSAQEDLALILAPLGAWMAYASWKKSRQPDAAGPAVPPFAMGVGIAVVSTVYLLLALTVLIPFFRAGAEVHYTSYFGELGGSPGDIARSLFTKPGAVFGKLFSARSVKYAVLLLLPYGFVPLRSPSRLLIAAPLFGVLCLMDTSRDPAAQGVEMLIPFHHFHAPLVPVIVWAATAGLASRRERASTQGADIAAPAIPPAPRVPQAAPWVRSPVTRAQFACWCAFATGLFYSLGPLGIAFWDEGSTWHWRKLYVPGPRAEYFPRVAEEIPQTARVASTDFVHPRFTHHERSYDYSAYVRKVSGYELRVPDDTEYIVIDTRHPYSTIKSPREVRELREEPERWELLPDRTEGYYIVLKRVR